MKKGVLFAIAYVAYLVVGFIGIVAMVHGISYWLPIPKLLACFMAMVIVWIPLVGSIFCVKGAMVAWNWTLIGALTFFGWPYVLFLGASLVGALFERKRP